MIIPVRLVANCPHCGDPCEVRFQFGVPTLAGCVHTVKLDRDSDGHLVVEFEEDEDIARIRHRSEHRAKCQPAMPHQPVGLTHT